MATSSQKFIARNRAPRVQIEYDVELYGAEKKVQLEVSPAAREWLALTGFDPAYGARPLRRLVQREIGDRLARAILSGEVRDGDTVAVDVATDGTTLSLSSR